MPPTIRLYTTPVLSGETVMTLDDRSVSIPSCGSLRELTALGFALSVHWILRWIFGRNV